MIHLGTMLLGVEMYVAGLDSPNSEDLRPLFIREYEGSPGSVPSNTHTQRKETRHASF